MIPLCVTFKRLIFKIIQAVCSCFFLTACTARPAAEKNLPPASEAVVVSDSIPFPVFTSFPAFEASLGQAADTVYVLNFWATWCKPCIAELPLFEKLIAENASKPLKVLLVSMDFPKDFQKKLLPFVRERRLEHSVIALADPDYDAWIDKISPEWDGAIPFTMIYSSSNRIFQSGELENYEQLQALIAQLTK